jgi:hypothetical protein
MNISPNNVVCFVADFRYLIKNFSRIYKELREIGKYQGDILIITSLLTPTFLIKEIRKKNNVKIFRFRKVRFNQKTNFTLKNLNVKNNRHIEKNFQWSKLHIFNKKLKKWDHILYFDINMSIHHDINPILKLKPTNRLLARADGFPDYSWKLSSQFDNTNSIYKNLDEDFDLTITHYFQSGLMFIDTQIITEKTFSEIISLVEKYPITITNEQAILNLYFIFIKNQYEELETFIDGKLSYYYWKMKDVDVIITKSLKLQFK